MKDICKQFAEQADELIMKVRKNNARMKLKIRK